MLGPTHSCSCCYDLVKVFNVCIAPDPVFSCVVKVSTVTVQADAPERVSLRRVSIFATQIPLECLFVHAVLSLLYNPSVLKSSAFYQTHCHFDCQTSEKSQAHPPWVSNHHCQRASHPRDLLG